VILLFSEFGMRHLVVPEVYTIIAFGISIGLWGSTPEIVLSAGVPLYSTHSYFALELFLMASTIIVWVTATWFFRQRLRRQNMTFAQGLMQDGFIAFLAVFTILVAIIGCAVYTSAPGPGSAGQISDLVGLKDFKTTNAFLAFNSLGALICEILWVILGLRQVSSREK